MTRRSIAVRLVGRWVRLYTFALPTLIAEDRRNEISSDLWEGTQVGMGSWQTLLRAVSGVPADLAWRFGHGLIPSWLRAGARLAAVAGLLFAGADARTLGIHPLVTTTMYVLSFPIGLLAALSILIGLRDKNRP